MHFFLMLLFVQRIDCDLAEQEYKFNFLRKYEQCSSELQREQRKLSAFRHNGKCGKR